MDRRTLHQKRASGGAHFLKERFMDKLDMLQSEISSLRMVVAIDSAMLLSVMRRMNGDQLALASKDFLEVCEGLSIKALFSEMDDHSIQSAQKRRDWWIGLLAEIVANDAVMQPQPSNPRPDD